MKTDQAHTMTVIVIAMCGVLVVAAVPAMVGRDIRPPRRQAPLDDGPAFVTTAPAVGRASVLNRLREIRRKARDLAAGGPDGPPVPGTEAELDGLIRDLTRDLEREGRP